MKGILGTIFGLIFIVIVFLVGGAFFIVDESEQVVITKFGSPIGEPINTPGLKNKLPFIQRCNRRINFVISILYITRNNSFCKRII